MGHVRRTVLVSWSFLLHIVFYAMLAAAVCATVSVCADRPELISATQVREAVSYLSVFVAAALAAHVCMAVDRWWRLRETVLGGIWCSVDDLTMILAAHYPSSAHRPLKTLVLRYCLLSVELAFMEARGCDSENVPAEGRLRELCQRGLLREDEREQLESLPCRPLVVWVWIAGTFQRLAEAGKLPSQLAATLFGICAQGRGSVGDLFAHLDTQTPYPYVHLVSVVVHVNNLIVATKCGLIAAAALSNLQRAESADRHISNTENMQVLLLQCVFAIGVPLVTLGLLEVGIIVSEPFSAKFQGFPSSAYHRWMRDAGEAMQTAAEEAPEEIARVADKVEVKEQVKPRLDCVPEV